MSGRRQRGADDDEDDDERDADDDDDDADTSGAHDDGADERKKRYRSLGCDDEGRAQADAEFETICQNLKRVSVTISRVLTAASPMLSACDGADGGDGAPDADRHGRNGRASGDSPERASRRCGRLNGSISHPARIAPPIMHCERLQSTYRSIVVSFAWPLV